MPQSSVQEVHARSEMICEAMIRGVCTWNGAHLHHRKMRSQGGGHEPNNLGFICDNCHRFIHGNTNWAYENGWLIHSWNEIQWPPNYYRGQKRKEINYGKERPDFRGSAWSDC